VYRIEGTGKWLKERRKLNHFVGRKRRRGPETGGKRQKRNETHRHKNDGSSGDEGESDKERVSACISHVSLAITRLPRTFLPPTPPLPPFWLLEFWKPAQSGESISQQQEYPPTTVDYLSNDDM